jgi:hypothetical protein
MTVREWFRVQRGVIWARDDCFQAAIEQVAAAVIDGRELPGRMQIAPDRWWILRDLSRYATEQRLCAAIEADMRRAFAICTAALPGSRPQ